MKQQQFISTIVAILVIFILGIYSITKHNDHLECTEDITIDHHADGTKVHTKRHNCKELYNF